MSGEGALTEAALSAIPGAAGRHQSHLIENLMTWFRVTKKSSDHDRCHKDN
jgi:hypothetical protein